MKNQKHETTTGATGWLYEIALTKDAAEDFETDSNSVILLS